jgi:hypothetical protein
MLKIFTDFKTKEDFDFLYNKFKNKPVTIFNDRFPLSLEELSLNPYNILIIHEPNEFFGFHNIAIQHSHMFSAIMTWSELILKNCSNAVWFDHGARNEDNNWVDKFKNITTKEFEISFLSGAKKLSEGHKFRQEIYKLEDQIKIPKKWFYVLDDFNWDDFNKGGIGRSVNPTTATFNNITTMNGNLNLPTTYVARDVGQLGWTPFSTDVVISGTVTLALDTWYNLSYITLPVGVWIVHGQICYDCTSAGTIGLREITIADGPAVQDSTCVEIATNIFHYTGANNRISARISRYVVCGVAKTIYLNFRFRQALSGTYIINVSTQSGMNFQCVKIS